MRWDAAVLGEIHFPLPPPQHYPITTPSVLFFGSQLCPLSAPWTSVTPRRGRILKLGKGGLPLLLFPRSDKLSGASPHCMPSSVLCRVLCLLSEEDMRKGFQVGRLFSIRGSVSKGSARCLPLLPQQLAPSIDRD